MSAGSVMVVPRQIRRDRPSTFEQDVAGARIRLRRMAYRAIYGPGNRSKYMPHQGVNECERRRERMK